MVLSSEKTVDWYEGRETRGGALVVETAARILRKIQLKGRVEGTHYREWRLSSRRRLAASCRGSSVLAAYRDGAISRESLLVRISKKTENVQLAMRYNTRKSPPARSAARVPGPRRGGRAARARRALGGSAASRPHGRTRASGRVCRGAAGVRCRVRACRRIGGGRRRRGMRWGLRGTAA